MSDPYGLQYGNIRENDADVIYEIPRNQTNLLEKEQLNELDRKEHFFFDCKQYTVDEAMVRIYYKREKEYRKLKYFYNASNSLKQRIASNLLSAEELIGTQYTTMIHPDNIYVNNDGNVKFAHRGIRAVLPPKEFTYVHLMEDLKAVYLYLFASLSVSEIKKLDMTQTTNNDPMIGRIRSATSIEQLEQFLKTDQMEKNKEVNPTPPVQKQKKTATINKQEQPKKKLSLLSGLLFGIVLGMIVLYVIKVMPLENESSALANELNSKQEKLAIENGALHTQLDNNDALMNGYHSAFIGETEEAISFFEGAKDLDKKAKQTLKAQYIDQGSLENLSKATDMNIPEENVKLVQGLVALNSKEANQVILKVNSDVAEIKIEQASIKQAHKDVIKNYQTIKDNKRAKLLAAKSYIALKNTKEAMKLGKELKNKDIQIASLEKDIELTKADKKLKKDKKQAKIKDLNEKLKKLKK